jgi:hypothetical protein
MNKAHYGARCLGLGLRLFWRAGLAVERQLPAWVPPLPRRVNRALLWCGITAQHLAPTPEERQREELFEEILARAGRSHGERSTTELRIVRLWDMFDGWIDVTGPIPEHEAQRIWNEKTANGTRNRSYADGDYYRIFAADTRMRVTPEFLGR